MHEFDAAAQALADRVLEFLRALAALDPTPLNGTIPPSELPALVRPMIDERGNDPATVLEYFTSVLAPAVIRADSPRFLAWIPSAPTKASMLFDAVVSLASISGVSWIESAGAISAENEANHAPHGLLQERRAPREHLAELRATLDAASPPSPPPNRARRLRH